MELYYSPLACSLAARIVCLEGGLAPSMRRADLATKRTEGRGAGALLELNALGKVPTLVCDDGLVLTENVAVLTYLGDQAPPESGLVPPAGSPARYEVLRWLGFVATELHKRVLAVVFSLERPPEAAKDFARRGASQALGALESHLRGRRALVGDAFTVADAYLVWALTLLPSPRPRVSLEPFPAVSAYWKLHVKRPSVSGALRAEQQEYEQPGWWTARDLGAG